MDIYILIKFLHDNVYLVHGSARAAETFTVSILKKSLALYWKLRF